MKKTQVNIDPSASNRRPAQVEEEKKQSEDKVVVQDFGNENSNGVVEIDFLFEDWNVGNENSNEVTIMRDLSEEDEADIESDSSEEESKSAHQGN